MSYVCIFACIVNITFDDNLRCTCKHNIYGYWWYFVFRLSYMTANKTAPGTSALAYLNCTVRGIYDFIYLYPRSIRTSCRRRSYIQKQRTKHKTTHTEYIGSQHVTTHAHTYTTCKHNLPNVNGQFRKQYWTQTPISYINEYTTTSTTTSITFILMNISLYSSICYFSYWSVNDKYIMTFQSVCVWRKECCTRLTSLCC